MGRHARPSTKRSGRRFLRIRAVLAGGVVLGLGATATLAAWNDSEFASATVTTSTFGIEGNFGSGYEEHPSPGSPLSFTSAMGQMSPGAVSYSSVAVRTTSTTSIGGTVSMSTASGPTNGSLAQWMRYGVRVLPAGTSCDANAFSRNLGTVVVPNATPLSTSVNPANSQPLRSSGEAPVTYCIQMSMTGDAPSSMQGQSTAVTWQWTGTSSA